MRSHTPVLIAFALLASVATPERALPQHLSQPRGRVYADSCLFTSEFQLHGVSLGSLSSVASDSLGKVLRVTTDSGEDDGGRYEVQTFHYRDVELADVRGFVDRLATRSPEVATPSGLRPGLTLQMLRQVLLKRGVRLTQPADTMVIGSCLSSEGSEPGVLPFEASIVLTLDKSRRVASLVMAGARP